MTKYNDIISLAQAKLYLKVDELQTVTDDEITNMINSSLSFIEKRTGHIFKTKNKTYYGSDTVVVYDYPIIEAPEGTEVRALNSIVPTVNGSVTLELGYTDVEDIPSELIDAALQMINFWFYNSETQNAMNTVPDFVLTNIDINRRFV